MIKTRIFKFVGHIHNMQLCIEMISFNNHENESILRWFSGLFSRILCPVAGCIQTGWGSDLCLPAVVLWNSAPHVSTMLRSNLDLSDSVLDMLQYWNSCLICVIQYITYTTVQNCGVRFYLFYLFVLILMFSKHISTWCFKLVTL